MDDQTLASLRAALDGSPENRDLRMVLVGAHLDRDETAEAYALVRELERSGLARDDHRRLAARACLAAGEAEAALAWVDAESPGGRTPGGRTPGGRTPGGRTPRGRTPGDRTPEALLLRARAFLALERYDDGRQAYLAAVAASPALEDVELRDRLAVKVRAFPDRRDAGRRLRVISNDDTDQSELSRLLVPPEETVTFRDVGGLEGIKEQIKKRIILPFQKPSLFRRFKKRVGGGILLYGPPGCGKTLLARATAGECEAEFLNVAIADVLDMYIGESERKLHALFENARAKTPSVLFFDEIEALGGKRQYTREATSSKLVSQFLSEMDGFTQANAGVLILAATNVPWAVDPAFRRPGRFDRLLFVPPPDREARAAVLGILLAGRPVAEGLDVAGLARRTSGFSGADLENLVETASDEAIEASIETGEEVPIHDDHLRAALRDVKPTTLEWLTTARNYARYANEAGQYDDVLRFLKKHGRG